MNRFHGVTLHPDTAAFLARPRRMLIGGEVLDGQQVLVDHVDHDDHLELTVL